MNRTRHFGGNEGSRFGKPAAPQDAALGSSENPWRFRRCPSRKQAGKGHGLLFPRTVWGSHSGSTWEVEPVLERGRT